MQTERGFSTIKMIFWLAVIGAAGWVAVAVTNVYYLEWKAQDVFDGITHNMSSKSVPEIQAKIPELYRLASIQHGDLPQEFYDNLLILATGSKVDISTFYHVTVWLIGPPEGVNPDEEYDDADLKGFDKVRAKLRMDFDFAPSSSTP